VCVCVQYMHCCSYVPYSNVPARFRKLPIDHNKARTVPDLCTTLGVTTLADTGTITDRSIQLLTTHLPPTHPLRYNWTDFVYTDGSVTPAQPNTPGIGAAVYIPPQNTAATSTQPQHDETMADDEGQPIAIDCAYHANHEDAAPACVNTINRAELAGIATAIQKGHVNIATDSLASMFQCQKMNNRPQDMKEHRHHNIIQHIIRTAAASPSPIHLWKVKSHIGIVGNEWADEVAVAVATGEELPEHAQHETFDMDSNNRRHMFWPYIPPPPQPQPNPAKPHQSMQTANAQQARPIHTPLANLAETLKDRSHNLHKLGQSNVNTTYFAGWQRMSDQINHKYSHAFMTSTLISSQERRHAIQYRNGLLYTQKLAKRYNHTTTSKCLLCDMEDGGHHAVSACPAVNAAVIKRHNQAGREIVKAISRGTHAKELIMSDVGMKKHEPKETPQQMQNRIPEHVLPIDIPPHLRHQLCHASVPDALLYRPPTAVHKGAKYTIVEIKYCRDTNTEEQAGRAAQQHRELAETIRKYDETAIVHQSTILLGVSGAMYNSSLAEMEDHLGIQGSRLKGLASRLHTHAVKSLTNILHYRRALERRHTRDASGSARKGRSHRRLRPNGQQEPEHGQEETAIEEGRGGGSQG